jgi:hypothetical protein
VVVDDLHVEGISSPPHETDTPLVVDSNAVLALPLALEFLETVAWRNAKVLNRPSAVQEQELPPGHTLESAEAWDVPIMKQVFHGS